MTTGVLYGVADMLVLGVGGFLLLPLYTRSLSQSDFGTYVIVKANADLLGYVLYVGILSAVGRLYFDYRDRSPGSFINSILIFVAALFAVAAAILSVGGDAAWHMISPTTPARPFLWYSLGIAAATFVAGLGALWLRLDNKVKAFATLQVTAAGTLAIAAYIDLVILHLGLPGLLVAFMVGYLPGTAVLLYRLRGSLRPVVDRRHVATAVAYGLPLAVGYIAYFVLNRFGVLALQRFQNPDKIAIYGLAQQLALVVAIASQALGKAIQPAVFGADPADAPVILHRSSRMFILLMFATCSAIVLFAREIIAVVAPRTYASGLGVLLILLVASFIYSLSLVSSTAFEFHRRPRMSATVSVFGAAMSIVFGLVLVPRFGLIGGAVSTLGAYTTTTIASHIMAHRLTRRSYFGQITTLTIFLGALAFIAAWPGWLRLPFAFGVMVKLIVLVAVLAGTFAIYAPRRIARLWRWRPRGRTI